MVLMLLSTIGPCTPGLSSPLSPRSVSHRLPSAFFAMINPVFNHEGPEDDAGMSTPTTPSSYLPPTPSKPAFSYPWVPAEPTLRPAPLNPRSRATQKELPPIPQSEQLRDQPQQRPQQKVQHRANPSTPPPSFTPSYSIFPPRIQSHKRSPSAPLADTRYMQASRLQKTNMPGIQIQVRQPSPGPAPLGPLPEIPTDRDDKGSTNASALAYTNVAVSHKRINTVITPIPRKPVPNLSSSTIAAKRSLASKRGSEEESKLSISIAMSGVDLDIGPSPTDSNASPPLPASASSAASSYFSSTTSAFYTSSPEVSSPSSFEEEQFASVSSSSSFTNTANANGAPSFINSPAIMSDDIESMEVPLLIEPRCLLQSPRTGGSGVVAGWSRMHYHHHQAGVGAIPMGGVKLASVQEVF